MKTIWIIDHYSSEPKYGGIQRQYDFAMELSKRGYQVVVISSSFSHYTHSYISDEKVFVSKIADNARYVYLKTTSYESNGGLGRIRNMFSFKRAVLKNYKQIACEFGKPDVVTGCSIHPLTWIAAYKVSKHFGCKFLTEVRDLWPEMWLLNGEKSKLDPMVLFFGSIEKWAYKKADAIIYSMLYGDQYICGKLGFPRQKAFLIGQPMNCDMYIENSKKQPLPQDITDFIKDSFTCVFTGYYMEYEGVYTMLQSAKEIKELGKPIKFLFLGSGKEEQGMKKYVADNHLDNVLVYGRIGKEAIPALLCSCDVCLAHCSTEGKPESFKYGVSKNKVNEYLYSGNCVIYGRDDVADPVAKYGAGYVVQPFHPEQFTQRILEVFEMNDTQRKAFGINGRKYVEEFHKVESLVDKLIEIYES